MCDLETATTSQSGHDPGCESRVATLMSVHPTANVEQFFAHIYDENWDDLRGYCQRRSPSSAEADDVLAETFLIAWKRVAELIDMQNPRPWLFAVARNLLREQYRKIDWAEGVTKRLMSELLAAVTVEVPGENTSADDLQNAVLALERLPDAERELIQLVAWDELSYPEVGELLGCSPNAVAIRLHRARARLTTEFSSIERSQQ